MPTHKPRLTITLPPHIDEVVSRLADLQGRSRSAVIVDVLEAVHRPWARSCALLEAAREAPGEVNRQVADVMEREVKGLETAFQTIDMFDHFAHGGHESDPPLVTRGSGTENQGVTKGHQGG
jgi:predicted transcriptional regulator